MVVWVESPLGWGNLTGADLHNVSLYDADLSRTNLPDVILSEANLSHSAFSTTTILHDGRTVREHGFNAVILETYLKKEGTRIDGA